LVVYAFSDRRLLRAARLYLAQDGYRHQEICGNSVAVSFPSMGARASFELCLSNLAGGETGIQVLEDGSWSELGRRESFQSDLYPVLEDAQSKEDTEAA
jgi:hypothetical protein